MSLFTCWIDRLRPINSAKALDLSYSLVFLPNPQLRFWRGYVEGFVEFGAVL